MLLSLELIKNISESFSLATGVPLFLLDGEGNTVHSSPGFSPQVYAFADAQALHKYLESLPAAEALTADQYYSLITENQFIYLIVPLMAAGQGKMLLISAPLRFHPPGEAQLVAILRGQKISLRKKTEIAEAVALLPRVTLERLEHLGRVLCSLCHTYFSQGISLLSDPQALVDEAPAPAVDLPKITFTLVEEGVHVPFEVAQQIRQLILSGDVAGIRALRTQAMAIPFDRLIEDDALRSVRYNLITAVASIIGMISDPDSPYEQLLMIGDKYIRLADQAKTIPEIMNLMFQSMEDFATIVKKYSVHQHSRPVRQVLQYIQNDLTGKVSLDELAEMTGLSPSYLSRLIKKETGMSLVDIINSRRMEESKYLLHNTDYSILQIAEMVGFTYQNHFTLRFKKYTGMTPSEFRRSGGAGHSK